MDAAVYIPFEDLVDVKAEIERLNAEKEKYEGLIARTKAQLANEQFVAKAPADKVAEVKEKQANYETMLASINERLSALKGSAAA
jgi:valyl-tRNA synthetase